MLADTAQMKPYRTSMKIDFDAGRPMEVEAIYGNPLRAAQAAGATLPRLETLYRQLKFLDQRGQSAE
jgi:2-dehydropantoate 2-reductase